MDNYRQTADMMPGWTQIPGLNPLTKFTGGAVADAVGGLTWSQAQQYVGTTVIGHARLAFGVTAVINGVLINGSLHGGMFVGSFLSPSVIDASWADAQCR